MILFQHSDDREMQCSYVLNHMLTVNRNGTYVLIIYFSPFREQRDVSLDHSTCTQTRPHETSFRRQRNIKAVQLNLVGPHGIARRRGPALSRLTCSLWPSWPLPPRDGTSPDVSGYFHFVSKSTLILLALKIIITFSVLIFFFSFAGHFGVFVVNIKQHLTLRKS